jgi:hypothetical protein
LGFTLRRLGSTLRRWALPSVVWVLPSVVWVLPSVVWVLPSVVWVLPSVVWVLPSVVWVLPSVVWVLPFVVGFSLRRRASCRSPRWVMVGPLVIHYASPALSPQILRRARMSRAHIPLKRGGADASRLHACLLGEGVNRAHISGEGRGLFPGGWMWMRVNRGCEGESGGISGG